MNSNGWLEQYYSECKTGKIVIGQTLMEMLRQLMSDIEDPLYFYDTTSADVMVDFIENCVRLTKSPFYGQPMKLMLFQKALISAMYGFKMSTDGSDRFKRVLLVIGRKNGKSELVSALALSQLILGQKGSDIVASSNDDSQASIVYDAIDTMRLMIDPEQVDTWRNQRHIRNVITDSKIFKLSDRTRNKEGRNIDIGIVDEIHEMRDNTIIKSIEQSQSLKDNPKLIMLTTEGFVNGGVLDNEIRKARALISGEDNSISSQRFLPWIYEQDSENEIWQERDTWVKSNPSLGVIKKWEYMDEQVDSARRNVSDRFFTLTKDFNFKVSTSENWLLPQDYDYECPMYELEHFKGQFCLGAVDLSATTDLSAVKVLLREKDSNVKYIHSHYFIPESKLEDSPDVREGAMYATWAREGLITVCEGNEVDLTAVADWFYDLYLSYGIKPYVVGYDQRFSKVFVSRMDDYSINTEMILQGKVLSNAMKYAEADFKSQRINYNHNPVDIWNFSNMAIQVDNLGNIMPVKIKGREGKRIDGGVAMVILYEVYRRYKNEFTTLLK